MWPTMNARYPQSESAEAIEGNAAHFTAWSMLANETPAPGHKAPNDAVVTEEMIQGAELLCETIETLNPGKLKAYIEQWLKVSIVNAECAGTPDYWFWDHNARHVRIIDYKFGHRFVDEFWNAQGLSYLAGIIEFLCKQWEVTWDKFPLDTEVSFTVVQPRCFYRGLPVRTHTFTVAEAVNHFNRLRTQADSCLIPEPMATTNQHCKDCPGHHACSALQLAAYDDAETSNARTPLELSPLAAALELRFLMRALDRLEARVDGLKELTIANMRRGERIPYFRIEQGYGRTAWKIPNPQIIEIGKLFGKDLSKPETVTPTQAIKMGVPEAIVKGSSFTPSTSTKLIPEKSTDAAKVFGR